MHLTAMCAMGKKVNEMIIKLNKQEVEKACILFLRASGYRSDQERHTSESEPIAIDRRQEITCKLTRSGVECIVKEKPQIKGS